MTCPQCESANVTERFVLESFPYGLEPDTIKLSCTVPVMTCGDCKQEWTDYVAEQARALAIQLYQLRKRMLDMPERTELQRGALSLYSALDEANRYADDLEKIPGGEGLAHSAQRLLDQMMWLVTPLMHPEDSSDVRT